MNELLVDEKDAPEGYVAVEGDCTECAFRATLLCPVNDNVEWVCLGENRKDGKDVHFVKEQALETDDDRAATVSVPPEQIDKGGVPTIPSNISLRDFFAGCAISGCMNASEEVYKVPERAYIVADMMLAEREKSLKEGKGEK